MLKLKLYWSWKHMQNLFNSERVQKELANFKSRLDVLEDGPRKKEVHSLINDLINEIKKVDSSHLEMLMTKRVPMMLPEARDSIMKLRRQIDSKLK